MSLILQTEEFLKLPFNQKGFFSSLQNRIDAKVFVSENIVQRGQRIADTHRLVKASKSPTSLDEIFDKEKIKFQYAFFAENHKNIGFPARPVQTVEPQKQITPHNTVGCSTVIQYREWAQEWRVRTQVDATSGSLPPAQEGERISELLSSRGAKKIAESCEYMSLKKGGYKTFVTGTFNEEIRAKIKAGETSIQKEVSRCMDAMQKMFTRGWVAVNGEKIAGSDEGLCYCWVVEIPVNENYEENPHVHMLLGWRVAYRHFAEWSKRIESIWGNGYFHLEKIKDCSSAGAYMAKAAGYMTKAQGNDSQGRVRGNRYGISEPARAPDWLTIGKSQLHSMGQIIADVYDHLSVQHGHQFKARRQLNEQLAATPKAAKWTRAQIGKKLEAVRTELKKLPLRCNKYQIILKGRAAADLFITWAKGEPCPRPEWLPELPKELAWQEGRMPTAGDSHFFRKLKKRFQELKHYRHAITNDMCAVLVEQWQEFRSEALSAYEYYFNQQQQVYL